MSVHTTTEPLTRSRNRRLIAGAAVLAAVATGAVLALTTGVGTTKMSGSTPQASTPAPSFSIMSLTPAQLAGGALGLGYALPSTQSGPTTASVLASMSPSTRRYTKAITALTFAQLKAGAAGSP